jgi:hypothetical protein
MLVFFASKLFTLFKNNKVMNTNYLSKAQLENSDIMKIVNDSHATHQKFLEFYMLKTTGDILEFGCGNSSTGLIRNLIKGTSRKLISYENNKEWYDKMLIDLPPNETHQYIFVTDWEYTIGTLPKIDYDNTLVFIDQSPWDARRLTMEYFKNIAGYVLIHDVDYFNNNNIFGTFKIIKDQELPEYDYADISNNWKLYYPEKPWPSPTGPPLLVFSNTGKEIYTFKEKKCELIGCGILECLCKKK